MAETLERAQPQTGTTVAAVPARRSWWRASWGRLLRRLAALALPFVLWDLAAAAAQNRLLPGPPAVLETLWELIADGTIGFHGALTLQRALTGLVIAVVVGVLVGVLLARVRWLDAAVEPLVAATYPVPKLALFPLLVLALGVGGASKVAMVAIECAYPIILTMYAGVQGIDKHYFWLVRNVQAPPLARLGVMIRATTPSLFASLRVAVPIALVIIVVTELIGENRGLGYLVRQAGADFEPATALAMILLLAIIGFVLDRLVVAAWRRSARWAAEVRL